MLSISELPYPPIGPAKNYKLPEDLFLYQKIVLMAEDFVFLKDCLFLRKGGDPMNFIQIAGTREEWEKHLADSYLVKGWGYLDCTCSLGTCNKFAGLRLHAVSQYPRDLRVFIMSMNDILPPDFRNGPWKEALKGLYDFDPDKDRRGILARWLTSIAENVTENFPGHPLSGEFHFVWGDYQRACARSPGGVFDFPTLFPVLRCALDICGDNHQDYFGVCDVLKELF